MHDATTALEPTPTGAGERRVPTLTESQGVASSLLYHPRRLFLRKVLFQVHLWVGVLLAVYIALIALSGSLLVFKEAWLRAALPPQLHRTTTISPAALAQATERFRHAYPQDTLTFLESPTPGRPALLLDAQEPSGRVFHVAADPATGELVPWQYRSLDLVERFHVYLLLPEQYGIRVNGIGAGALLLLAVTGLPLWWSGLRVWTRGLRVRFRANWRRTNYDLHLALGFWMMAIVCWWAISGFYFGFSGVTGRMVNAISPIQLMREPETLPASNGSTRLPLLALLQTAQQSSPSAYMMYVSDPLLAGSSITVTLDRGAPGDFSHADIVTLDTSTGRVLRLWHYGEKRSLGDWLIWFMYPLHFGTLWGLACKVLYAALGVGLALLSLSGLLMYWNRFLRGKAKKLMARPQDSPARRAV